MKKLLAAAVILTLTSAISYAIEKKSATSSVKRDPATQGEFTECFGLIDQKAVSAFDRNNNYAELKAGSRVTVPLEQGDIIVQVSNVTTGTVAPKTPEAGSGWNDVINSVTILEGSVVITGSTGNPIRLACERHYRGRY